MHREIKCRWKSLLLCAISLHWIQWSVEFCLVKCNAVLVQQKVGLIEKPRFSLLKDFTPQLDVTWHFVLLHTTEAALKISQCKVSHSMFCQLSPRIRQIHQTTVLGQEIHASGYSFPSVLYPHSSCGLVFLLYVCACVHLNRHTYNANESLVDRIYWGTRCFPHTTQTQHHRGTSASTATGACLC